MPELFLLKIWYAKLRLYIFDSGWAAKLENTKFEIIFLLQTLKWQDSKWVRKKIQTLSRLLPNFELCYFEPYTILTISKSVTIVFEFLTLLFRTLYHFELCHNSFRISNSVTSNLYLPFRTLSPSRLSVKKVHF